MGQKVGIIGFGSMGGMIARKMVETGAVAAADLHIANRTPEKIAPFVQAHPGIAYGDSNRDAASFAEVLFLCVKPADMKGVLDEIGGALSPATHIVSINASVMFAQLESACPGMAMTKCVPSVTAEVGESVTLVCHNAFAVERSRSAVRALLAALGTVEEISEDELGIVSELTSCMPGFVSALFRVIASEASRHMSLDQDSIRRMLMRTLHGTSALFLEGDYSFDGMLSRVATKGGITEEGAKVIDAQFPKTVAEIFAKTMEKRAVVRQRSIDQFNG